MTIEIPITHGLITIVDDVDTDLVSKNWLLMPRKTRQYAYRTTHPVKATSYLHREVMERVLGRELLKNEWVDHINHNGLDNRRINLRLTTPSRNMANSRLAKNNTSGKKGVSWNKKAQKWEVSICFNGKKIKLGNFSSLDQAAAAYDAKALEFWGEHAWTNDMNQKGR